jgi:hypothetical protein
VFNRFGLDLASDTSTSNSPSTSPPHNQLTPLRTSSSFSSFRNDDSWTPEPINHAVKKYNPFLDEEEPEEHLHPIAQQYLIIKGLVFVDAH